MSVLGNLGDVFAYFEEIAAIPHGSGNTKAISDYCVKFAKRYGLEYYQDEYNNVIIIKPASSGYENSPAVIIQGHLDMVCEKAADADIDMNKEGLRLAVDGDFIYAKGTTLGGDDGIAIAYALTLLAAKDLQHPRIEAVFTVDEETGMTGASVIDLSALKGRRLLNIDSEVEGILTVSCAGGATAICTVPVNRITETKNIYKITLTGLSGGHSGIEINKGHKNANVLMARFLYALSKKLDFNIVNLSGGQKDNVIPSSCTAEISADSDGILFDTVEKYRAVFEKEVCAEDAGFSFFAENIGHIQANVLDKYSTDKTIAFLNNLPNGVTAMSQYIEGLVQTSLNIGVLELEANNVKVRFSVRSSVGTEKYAMIEKLESLTDFMGGAVSVVGEYPAWEYKKNSELRNLMTEVYVEQYGQKPKIEAIHAGLECGIFCGKLEGLDAVSFGPDLLNIHTPSEKMSISSVKRVWNYIVEILKRSK